MFRLVGEYSFYIDEVRCILRIEPAPGFKYDYSLCIDGKTPEEYTEEQINKYRFWLTTIDNIEYRIMLDLETLNLFINDHLRPETVRILILCK